MYKCYCEEVARQLATEHGLLWGVCIFDGAYYVGTVAQFEKCGVIAGAA
jgi:hypothetical protein